MTGRSPDRDVAIDRGDGCWRGRFHAMASPCEGLCKTDSAGQAKEAQAKTEAAQGQTEGAQAQTQEDAKVISGMSILGNQEAPKSLVIVPWKSSDIGNSMDISTMLDDSRQPVDKEVFMRALSYYEIRLENTQ